MRYSGRLIVMSACLALSGCNGFQKIYYSVEKYEENRVSELSDDESTVVGTRETCNPTTRLNWFYYFRRKHLN